jgi:hypothetical protein
MYIADGYRTHAVSSKSEKGIDTNLVNRRFSSCQTSVR